MGLNLKKSIKIYSLATLLVAAAAGTSLATPSTQIWIPSLAGNNTFTTQLDINFP